MTNKSHIRIITIMFILFLLPLSSQPVSGIEVWTAHVEWDGYSFPYVYDCGDGYDNRCENIMKIKRTTSSSCASTKTWIEGDEEYTYTFTDDLNPFYELTWVRVYGAPCLTFDVYFVENTAGASTDIDTFTINMDGSYSYSYLDLNLGSANGEFRIKYWVSATD